MILILKTILNLLAVQVYRRLWRWRCRNNIFPVLEDAEHIESRGYIFVGRLDMQKVVVHVLVDLWDPWGKPTLQYCS